MKISRRARPLLGALVILAAMAYLMAMGVSKSSAYYYTVEEFLSRLQSGNAPLQQRLRVSGDIVASSVQWHPKASELRFALGEAGRSLPVVYHGAQPDNFTHATSAIVEGKMVGQVFVADKLMLKCPSKYEAAAPATAAQQGKARSPRSDTAAGSGSAGLR